MALSAALCRDISVCLGQPLSSQRRHGCGCLGPTYVAQTASRKLFIKTGARGCLNAFEAEMDGLLELAGAGAVRVPGVVGAGLAAQESYLVMEYLALGSNRTGGAERLGRELARQHRVVAEHFGWRRDNTIGTTHQANRPTAGWVEFFERRRLRPQLEAAERNGLSSPTLDLGFELSGSLHLFFTSYQPSASLLHGDLWSGNCGVVESGEPVIFDPAVYYGDRECDIAMTMLFGGFPESFYAAYQDVWPLDPGFVTRKTLYNLFHVLNHFNMFGGSYAAQAHDMLARLVRELR